MKSIPAKRGDSNANEMRPTENPNVDSDLYIVSNPNGPGKTVIRRPHPPPTTVALDEDFDAVTVEEDSTIYGGDGGRYANQQLNNAIGEVSAVDVHHTNSPEYGNLGLRMGQVEGELSDLNIEIGRVISKSVRSSPRLGGPVADQTRARRIMSTEEGRRPDSRISNANIGDGDGTQISYEEFCGSDIAIELTTQANRKRSHLDLNQNKSDERGGGSGSKGNGGKGMCGRRTSMGGKNNEQLGGFPSPIYSSRSERMYSAAELDVPPPPSEFTPSEPGNISGSLRTKKNKDSRDQPRTSALIKPHPLRIRHPSSSTDNAKASSMTSLDEFLCSFRPSLVHIAPILTSLGIRDEDHFRAIASLSEETRDREVREIALQKGMTVVEWAMLLDRIRSLY